MVFHPPSWVPSLPDPPDSITVEEFMSNEAHGRYPLHLAHDPYVCGFTGKRYSAVEVVRRTAYLSRAIGSELGFHPHEGTEWDRVVCLYSLNTIDYIPLTHAIHRLSGIVTPASAAYSVPELEHQLRTSGAKALFTCVPLLSNAVKAAKAVGISEDFIFILPMPNANRDVRFKTIDDLIEEGQKLPEREPMKWTKGQGARQVAFLSYSSGTSGLPKAVMISHYNIIANILQTHIYESVPREKRGIKTQTGLGLLPFSHIYGLTLVAHVAHYRGDSLIVLPRFELKSFLNAVQRFKIEHLSIVPPILIQIRSNQEICNKYDLGSIRALTCGAAPLGTEVAEDLHKLYPKWFIGQAYGMTESSPLVTSTSELDLLVGSSGSLIAGAKAKIIDADGNEVTAYDTPGELLVQAPAVVLGYLNNERANAETFVYHNDGRWLRTGDEVVVRKSPKGHEHFVVVDRIKELIKVKGHQVAPAELEAHLLTHPFVSDCAVIPIQDAQAGEAPKAFVVKSKEASDKSDSVIVAAIRKHVEEHKARHKWLTGGVEFTEAVPKSASGKILRRLLRDREKHSRKERAAKL